MVKPARHLLLLLILAIAACTSRAPRPIPLAAVATLPLPSPTSRETARSLLTYADLMKGVDYPSPVEESTLAAPPGATAPAHVFEGRLELMDEATRGQFEQISGPAETNPALPHIPEFDFEFVQSGSALIPVQRGLIVTTHSVWNYYLEPGRVWQEDGDQSLTRASFPFALVVKNGNATYNGVMTFLFDDVQVSKVWYQITQETANNPSADFWGWLPAVYHQTPVAKAEQLRQAYAEEVAQRFPVRPIEQLAADYPGVDPSAFGRGITPEHMTFYGLVVNGINYVGGCRTRFGVYPYCESLRAASYSTAKSAFVSVALMRLAQKYGSEVADLLIKDYLPETAAGPGDWSHVTFNHTLDMATGNYASPGYMVDEEGRIFSDFFGVETYTDKMKAALDWPHSAEPGTLWNYRSSDTFLVATAMRNYLRSKEGPDADLFQFVVDEVYRRIHIGPGFFSTTRTSENNWKGEPIGSYGLWWTPDDVAKLTTLLNVDRGAAGGARLLDPGLLAAALQQDPRDRGVALPSGGYYNNAFWSAHYARSAGSGCEFWVPYMAGYSGNIVALLPNGLTYYYFSDGREFTWEAAVREADKIKPLCSSLVPAFVGDKQALRPAALLPRQTIPSE